MNDLDELIQFLRLNRRREEASEDNETNVVMATVLDTGQEIEIDKISFNNLDTYKRVTNIFENFNATRIYHTQSSFDRRYYVKQPVFQADGYNFINIDTNFAEQISEDDLFFIDIEYAFNQYVFDTIRKKVILIAKGLEVVTVFSDAIVIKPENLDVSTGTYFYTFDDHKTLFGTISSAILNPLLSLIQLSDREVDLYKSDTTGSIYLIPRIGYSKGKYTITYLYTKSKKNFSGSIAQEDIALHLEFNFVGAFISFLNETILLEENFSYQDEEANDRRLDFVDDFERLIVLPLERNIIGNSSGNYKDAITVLYYLGDDILFSLSQDTLWKVVDEAIKNDTLVNHSGAAEENIVLKLIKFIAERERDKNNFLIKLLEKTSHDKISYLQFLYDRIDGENSTAFVKTIHKAWMQSSFIEIDPEKSKVITNDSPVILDYRSNTTLAFHTDNAEVEWKINTISVNLTVGTGVYQTSKIRDGHGGTKTKTEEVMEIFHYNYHPFSPIALINADNPTFIFKDSEQQNQAYTLLPAFVIYAHTKSAFVKNWLTVAEYTVDILTTLSGVGNILKVGRLAKIIKAGHTLIGKTKTATQVIKGVKAVAGVVEVSSGTGNALLKLLDLNDSDFGREIAKYLFYLEMLSLSGELTVAIHAGLTKSAKKLVEKTEDLAKLEKQLDDLVGQGKVARKEADDLLVHLDEIAEISEAAGSIKYLTQAKHLDNFGSLKQVSTFEDEVRELSYEVARFFDEAGRAISKSISQKSSNSVGFKLGEIDDIVKTSGKDSRSIILSHNHPTSTGISADDIKIVINNKLGGIRAVAKDGSNYLLKNIGKMTRDDFTKLTPRIAERVRQKYPRLAKKGSRKDTLGRPLHKASSKKLAQTLTDELVEELINLKQVEYIKYQ